MHNRAVLLQCHRAGVGINADRERNRAGRVRPAIVVKPDPANNLPALLEQVLLSPDSVSIRPLSTPPARTHVQHIADRVRVLDIVVVRSP